MDIMTKMRLKRAAQDNSQESVRLVYAYMLGRFGKGDVEYMLGGLSDGSVPSFEHWLAIGTDAGWIDECGNLTEAFRKLARSKP